MNQWPTSSSVWAPAQCSLICMGSPFGSIPSTAFYSGTVPLRVESYSQTAGAATCRSSSAPRKWAGKTNFKEHLASSAELSPTNVSRRKRILSALSPIKKIWHRQVPWYKNTPLGEIGLLTVSMKEKALRTIIEHFSADDLRIDSC